MIGAVYGVQQAGGNQAATVDIIQNLLKCPSNIRVFEDGFGMVSGNYQGSYTYNTSLGDWRAMDPLDPKYPSFKDWAYYKKRVNVPHNVVVAPRRHHPGTRTTTASTIVGDLTTAAARLARSRAAGRATRARPTSCSSTAASGSSVYDQTQRHPVFASSKTG